MIGDYTQQFTMPTQKLSLSRKDKSWKEQCVSAVIGRSYSNSYLGGVSRVEQMRTNYDLYNGIYNLDDLKYVTNPFNVSDGFPASPQEMNIIRPKIDLLIGEESKRPRNIHVIHSNPNVVSQLQRMKRDLLMNYVGAQLLQGMQMDDTAVQDADVMAPEQIEQYLSTEYKDIAEIAAHHTLNYLYNKLNLDHEFLKNWKDALISGEEIGYVGVLNGEPVYERVNPIFFAHDMSPDLEFIEDGDWAVRSMWMTPQEIYDRYYDKLKPSDLDELLHLSNQHADGTLTYPNGRPGDGQVNTNYMSWKSLGAYSWLGDYNTWNNGLIRVWHATWRSFKKIGFLTFVDESGEPQEVVVDESYKPSENEKVQWDWVVEIWEGYKAGQEKFFGVQPLEYQNVSLDNPNSQRLPYCGAVYSNSNSRSRSLVDIMKSLQYFYIILWYRLELMLARDNGKAFLMDINQIPRSSGMDPAQWMHYLKSFGVVFVDPYENMEKLQGRASSFNTYTAIDMSMANVIDGYVQLMNKIEEMAGELSGVSKQRQGQIQQSELVGNVERSVMQSAHITEWLFWTHGKFKKNVLQLLLDTARYTYSRYDKKKLHYLLDDTTRIFMQIPEEFEYSDFDVFVSDSTKENNHIEAIKSLLQPALQNGASLLDACDIVTADNVTMLKKKISEIEQKRMQLIQQQQQAEAQQAQQIAQMQQQTEQFKAENQFRIEELKSQTQLQVAQISATAKIGDQNANASKDIIENRKLELERYKANLEIKAKEAELMMKQRESDLKAKMQAIDLEAKAEQAMVDREVAQIGLQQKAMEAKAASMQASADIAAKQADLQMKAADQVAKEQDVRQKMMDVDIKEIERQIKEAELQAAYQEAGLRGSEIENEATKTAIMNKEADDKTYIEEGKLTLESIRIRQEKELKEKELKIKREEMEAKKDIEKIKLKGEQIKIEQTEAQIRKSKADVVKAEQMSEIKQKNAEFESDNSETQIDIAKNKGEAKIESAKADKEAAKIKASIPKPKASSSK
jgi:hypothetical protein